MADFERITHDLRIVAGQACIRDTGIPVYEVAMWAMHGHSAADILAKYPTLTTDDLVEAIAFAMREKNDLIIAQRYDLNSGFAQLQGGFQLLNELGLASEINDFSDEDWKLVGEIFNLLDSTLKTSHRIFNTNTGWLSITDIDSFWQPEFQRVEVAYLIDQAVANLPVWDDSALVQVMLPDALPPIRVADQTGKALGTLISLPFRTTDPMPRQITASTYNNTVRIDMTYQWDMDASLTEDDLRRIWFSPGQPSVAAVMAIRRNDGQVAASVDQGNQVRLKIDLPRWHHNTE